MDKKFCHTQRALLNGENPLSMTSYFSTVPNFCQNQSSKFTLAVGNCRGFCRGKQCFYCNYLGKNNAEVIISWQNIYSVYNFQYLFLDKIFIYKQEISLVRAREVSVCATRSQINYIYSAVYSFPFSLFTWQWNKLCFHVLCHCISEIL